MFTAVRSSSSIFRRSIRLLSSTSQHHHSQSPPTAGTRSTSPPIAVTLTETAGRGVFATRPIAAGELIHTATPIVTHPNPFLSSHKVCYYCLRRLGREDSPDADGIATRWFCSESCREQSKVFYEVEQKADWLAYDEHCRSRGLKYPLMVKRLACMVISGAIPPDSLEILQPTRLLPETILQMEEEFDLLKDTLMKAKIEEELMAFLTKHWYVNVLARIRINSFRIELVAQSYDDLLALAAASVEAEAAVGNALYMLPSFYNHDCDPNTHIIWIDNADSRLKALRNIEAGEELRICYIDTSMDGEARRAVLSQGFGFHCKCLRCSSGD